MLPTLCRVCGKYADTKKSLKIFDKSNQMVLQHIEILTGLLLENFIGLPELICDCCQQDMHTAIKFRERCLDSQKQLLTLLSEDQLQLIPEIYRSKFESDETTENIIEELDQMIEQEYVIETVEEEVEVVENQELKQEFIIDIDDPKIETTSEYETEIPQLYPNSDDIQEETLDQCSVDDLIYNSEDELAVLDLVLDDDDSPKAKSKEKRKRQATGLLVFICDECGRHVVGRKAFELHGRRHRGEKQHECDVCQNRFCTSSELKRHMRKHTGERPFACQFCERRFTDYSTRIKHERTHTNERPYVCKDCGKAFTTSYILKNHMLVHSGERAFRCDLCDKSFMRNTHLANHYRSDAHKRKLAMKFEADDVDSS